jgi:hypothetical protein
VKKPILLDVSNSPIPVNINITNLGNPKVAYTPNKLLSFSRINNNVLDPDSPMLMGDMRQTEEQPTSNTPVGEIF